MKFTPLKDFYSERLRSSYCVGLNYTVRAVPPDPEITGDPGTPLERTPLYEELQTWLAKGIARLGTADAVSEDEVPGSRVNGKGVVK